MSQEVYILRKNRDSRFKGQALCTSRPSYVLPSVSCALSFPCLIFLLITCLWYGTPVVNADEVGEHRVYVINRGDQLLISVVGHESELMALPVVRPDGMISYPVVGDVEAAGLTIAQLSAAISKRLSDLKFYEDPQVTVQLQEPRQESIYIFGDVGTSGKKQFPRAVNVVEALAAAGGFKETADLADAKIIKTRRKEIIPVDLRVLVDNQDAISDKLLNDGFVLEDGDVLIVPSTVKTERISIIGHVNMAGQFSVKSSVTLVEALAFAGGPLTTADLRHIRIIKPDGTVIVADATRLWAGMGPANSTSFQTENEATSITRYVEPGDSVVVLEKAKVYILGTVEKQGQFDVNGEIGIMEALALAGIANDSNLKRLRIVRSTGERLTVNATEIWKRQGPEAEIKLAPGDTLIVPTVFKINWNLVNIGVITLSGLYAILK